MLSGDIGCGKSTILQAIEFALFGLLRAELSGNSLLRNGALNGSAELCFSIGPNKYIIKRTLKRGKSVEQDAGYLITNDVKQEATATELKSKILELLGYPEDQLTKAKNYLYRYTVYTPQEEMKRIILEENEQRVSLLRKVFDIDKYARIKTNAATYAKALRERKRAFEAASADLPEKRKQAEQCEHELAICDKQLKELAPQLSISKDFLIKAKQDILELENKRSQAENTLREFHVKKTQLASKEQQQNAVLSDLKILTEQTATIPEQTPIEQPIAPALQSIQKDILLKEAQLRSSTIKTTEFTTLKKQARESSQKIISLAQCPTCLQTVSDGHKHSIISKQEQTIEEYDSHILNHKNATQAAEKELSELKTRLEELRKQERDFAVNSARAKHKEQLTVRKTMLESQHSIISQSIQTLRQETILLEQQTKLNTELTNTYETARKTLDDAGALERSLSIQHAGLFQKKETLSRTLIIHKIDIERKEKAIAQLDTTNKRHYFVTDYFTPLLDIMEKHVMARIHHEFDALFQQWFAMLVEDLMTARLDDTYTPIISQNGYDTEVENLSGGEKTACALAYRLALNKTINSLISGIKTKDLLILDEPTDGFSAEQLDKLRDVLSQLNLNQIIIVSHEQKVEGFANQVIRIRKENHQSIISA